MGKEKNRKIIDLTSKWCVAIELGQTDNSLLSFAHLIDIHLRPKHWDLVHVVPAYEEVDFHYDHNQGNMMFSMGFRQESVQRLEAMAAGFRRLGPGRQIRTMIEAGDPFEQLLSDKYVAGSNNLMLGKKEESTSSMEFIVKLTRNHSGPVWIVPEKFEAKLSSILIPLDYSPNSIRALRNADNLARQWDSPVRLFVMHVYSPPAIQAARVLRSRNDYDDDQEAFRIQALRDLLVTELGDRGKDVEIILVQKDQPGIAQYIERQVIESGIDLVVMGAKGYSRIERLVMGSVTEKWLQLNNVSATWVIK